MQTDLRPYLYTKNQDKQKDDAFSRSVPYGKVRLAEDCLFWRTGFRWYGIPLTDVRRIHRRLNTMVGRLCAGGKEYNIEYLVLILADGQELVVHIIDNNRQTALDLMDALQRAHPELKFGKE